VPADAAFRRIVGGRRGRVNAAPAPGSAADPEEELDIFLTPRPDGGFERYRHIPDHAPMIAGLARRMREVAEGMADAAGVRIADDVLASLRPRLAAAAGSAPDGAPG
jgi:hypothetical protein